MDIYTDYAKTRQQIQVLTDKMKSLESAILEEIKGLSSPIKNDLGTFTTVTRTVIKLSEDAVNKQSEIKDEIKRVTEPLNLKMKEIEAKDIESGKATKEEVLGMRFIEAKK